MAIRKAAWKKDIQSITLFSSDINQSISFPRTPVRTYETRRLAPRVSVQPTDRHHAPKHLARQNTAWGISRAVRRSCRSDRSRSRSLRTTFMREYIWSKFPVSTLSIFWITAHTTFIGGDKYGSRTKSFQQPTRSSPSFRSFGSVEVRGCSRTRNSNPSRRLHVLHGYP